MKPTPSRPEPLLLQANFNQALSTIGAGAILLGIASVAVVLFSDDVAQALVALFLFMGSFWAALILIMGLNDGRLLRRERADASRLFEGEAWHQWRWTLDEWRAELAQRRALYEQQTRWQKRAPLLGAVAGIIIGACALLPVFFGGEEIEPRFRDFIIGIAIFFGVLAFILSVIGARREGAKNQRRMERSEALSMPWVVLGAQGFYHEADGHTSLRALDRVRFDKKNNTLIFYLRHRAGRNSWGGSMSYLQDIHLPVPTEQLDAIPALVKRYRTERRLDD